MKFLNRKIRSEKPAQTEDVQTIVHREIEIFVEREWISVTAGTRVDAGAQSPLSEQGEPGLALPTGLPPPKRD
jgi:hypothetical protein